MQAYSNILHKTLVKTAVVPLAAVLLLALPGCKQEDDYLYQVQQIKLQQQSGKKDRLKSAQEFFSILYIDLFGRVLPDSETDELIKAYASVGDKQLITDMIVLTYLTRPGLTMPSDQQMRADLDTYIEDTYQKLYLRAPTSYERWYWRDYLTRNTSVSSMMVYYSFLTSMEYLYY